MRLSIINSMLSEILMRELNWLQGNLIKFSLKLSSEKPRFSVKAEYETEDLNSKEVPILSLTRCVSLDKSLDKLSEI